MSAALYNLAAMTVASTGSGTITLGAAATILGVKYLSFAQAGVPDGALVYYAINDVNASEVGMGTYTASGTTLTRGPINSTNGNAAIVMTAAAIVRITPVASQSREILTAGRTYYVRFATGSDANTGFAPTSAFKNIQKAIDTVAGLDIGTQNVVIQCDDNVNYGPVLVNGPWLGSGTVTLQGNTTTPANCVITQPGAGQSAVTVQSAGQLIIQGFKVVANGGGAGAAGLKATAGATLTFSSMDFGACSRQIQASAAGTVSYAGSGTYNISAGAVDHWFASAGGNIVVEGATVNTAGTPAFSGRFANIANLGVAFVDGNTFTGTGATGKRYEANTNGVIFTNGGGATYIPGSIAGTTDGFGVYS